MQKGASSINSVQFKLLRSSVTKVQWVRNLHAKIYSRPKREVIPALQSWQDRKVLMDSWIVKWLKTCQLKRIIKTRQARKRRLTKGLRSSLKDMKTQAVQKTSTKLRRKSLWRAQYQAGSWTLWIKSRLILRIQIRKRNQVSLLTMCNHMHQL